MTRIYTQREINGLLIPGIIRNDSYFFVDLKVYEDGTIDCWELTDLKTFIDKLNSGWVKTIIPNGKSISIHGLGGWVIDNGVWKYDKQGFFDNVVSTVKTLNPQMTNLYQKVDKKINGVTIRENRNSNIYTKKDEKDFFSKKILGNGFHLFYLYENKYYLSRVIAYKDGRIEISNIPNPIFISYEEFKKLKIGPTE